MKKILIIKHGSLGDIVFALPALASIRAAYSYEKIYLFSVNKEISASLYAALIDAKTGKANTISPNDPCFIINIFFTKYLFDKNCNIF